MVTERYVSSELRLRHRRQPFPFREVVDVVDGVATAGLEKRDQQHAVERAQDLAQGVGFHGEMPAQRRVAAADDGDPAVGGGRSGLEGAADFAVQLAGSVGGQAARVGENEEAGAFGYELGLKRFD